MTEVFWGPLNSQLTRNSHAQVVEVGGVYHVFVTQLRIGARYFAHHIIAVKILVGGAVLCAQRGWQRGRSGLALPQRRQHLPRVEGGLDLEAGVVARLVVDVDDQLDAALPAGD